MHPFCPLGVQSTIRFLIFRFEHTNSLALGIFNKITSTGSLTYSGRVHSSIYCCLSFYYQVGEGGIIKILGVPRCKLVVKLDKLMLDYLKDGWGFVCGVEGPNIQPNLMSEICGLSVAMCVEMLKCYLCSCGFLYLSHLAQCSLFWLFCPKK